MSLPPELSATPTETFLRFARAALADQEKVIRESGDVRERDAARDRIDIWSCIIVNVEAHPSDWPPGRIDVEEQKEIQDALDSGFYDELLREVLP